MNDKVKARVEKTPAEKINVWFAYNEDTQEIILTKDGVINRIDVSTLISHNEKDDTETIFIPRKATNGDVIKAMFPKATISKIKSKTEQTKIAVEWHFENIPSYYNLFYEDWWNAPYKGAQE